MPLKRRIAAGKATPEEKIQFAGQVQQIVKKVITALPDGVIIVREVE